MIKSRFLDVFRGFSASELKNLRNLFISPALNSDSRLVQAFDEICFQCREGMEELDERRIYSSYYGSKRYDSTLLRLILSKTYKLVLHYIYSISIDLEEKIIVQSHCIQFFRHHHHDNLFEEYSKRQLDSLEQYPKRNDQYFNYQYQHLLNNYLYRVTLKREGTYNINELSDSIDTLYIIRRLKNICRIYNLKDQQFREVDTLSVQYIYNLINLNQELIRNNVLAFYFYMSECYAQQFSEEKFSLAKDHFLNHESEFDEDESRENFLILLNYGIRKVNQGVDHYKEILFDLYEKALERNYLLENNIISRFTYRNITEAALSVKKFEWAEQFISKYKSKLEPAFQKFLYAFTKSRVLVEQKKFSEALDYISNINFDDPLMELACRLERIRIFVELKNYDLSEYHIKSMLTFILRNNNIGYQSKYYKNFAKYLLRILQSQSSDKLKIKKLKTDLQEEEIITERKWLVGVLFSLVD